MRITPIQKTKIAHYPSYQKRGSHFAKAPMRDTLNISFKQSAKSYLDSLKYIPTEIWVADKRIKNPEIVGKSKAMEGFSQSEKNNFVKEYGKMTGFPNLKEVTNKIDNEILKSVKELGREENMKPLLVAYDSNCSVAREKALPGSDCDGLIVITDTPESEKMNRAVLGMKMNQRVVDTTGKHFPEMFTIEQMVSAIEKAEEAYKENNLDKNKEKYQKNISYDGASFIKAGRFNIDIANCIEDTYERDMICHAALFVENLRAGKVLLNDIDEKTLDYIKGTSFYKYSNITRQEGLSKKIKPKLENRVMFVEKFSKMNDEEKFQACKKLMNASIGNEDKIGTEGCFENFNMGDILEMYGKICSWMASFE